MNFTSINRLRFARFVFTFALAFVIWWPNEMIPDGNGKIIFVLIPAVLFAGLISFLNEVSGAGQADLYIRKDALKDIVQDLELCGFKKLRSGKKMYFYKDGELAIISDEEWHYKAQLPSRYELIGEAYRKF